MSEPTRVPSKAWVVVFAGTAMNLCLGILYAWSVWKKKLANTALAGQPIPGDLNEGWVYLTKSEANWAYSICGFVFALCMIPGGRIQDRYGPKVGATLGGLCLALGCIVAGLMRSYTGLILGFGILGGIGMGFGYAASTPAAVRWFGAHRRALIVGIVVGGYGGAAIYISPLADWLINNYGISGSFIGLGILFAVVVIVAGQLLSWPPPGYVPPPSPKPLAAKSMTTRDWTAGEMLRTWQFYALVFLFIGSAQSGLLVIANAALLLNKTAALSGTAATVAFFAVNAWLLPSFSGFVNASGRVGTGFYSDKIGRRNAYLINGLLSAACLLCIPSIIHSGNVVLLFLVVGIAAWQYGGGLALMPALTADYFGSKNLGLNYGLVFIGWGIAFFVPQIADYLTESTGHDDYGFYLSAGILIVAILVSRMVTKPEVAGERDALKLTGPLS